MSQFMPPTYPKPAPAGSSEAPAMSPYDLDVLARVLDADVPPLSAAAVEALDTNSDGSVSSEELSAVLTLVRSLLPTDYDKVALSALLARYSSPPPSGQPPSPHLRGLIQQQQQNQAPPPNVRATRALVLRATRPAGRATRCCFPCINSARAPNATHPWCPSRPTSHADPTHRRCAPQAVPWPRPCQPFPAKRRERGWALVRRGGSVHDDPLVACCRRRVPHRGGRVH